VQVYNLFLLYTNFFSHNFSKFTKTIIKISPTYSLYPVAFAPS